MPLKQKVFTQMVEKYKAVLMPYMRVITPPTKTIILDMSFNDTFSCIKEDNNCWVLETQNQNQNAVNPRLRTITCPDRVMEAIRFNINTGYHSLFRQAAETAGYRLTVNAEHGEMVYTGKDINRFLERLRKLKYFLSHNDNKMLAEKLALSEKTVFLEYIAAWRAFFSPH